MNKRILLILLVSASVITMMSTDLYVPSLAHLPELLGTSPEWVKLTVSLNIAAYGIATLVHGPLSERFGRRPVLLWGMVGFTLASFLCAGAADIGQLLFARILQGIAAAVEGVVVLAIIRDVFSQKEQVRAIAIYGIATAFAPAVAPLLGGYIHVYFGWRMNFYFLSSMALLVTLLIALLLKEIDRKRLQCAESEGNYRRLLQLAQQQVVPALYHYRRLQSGLYFCLYYRRALCPDKKPWCGNRTFWLLPGSARPCLCHRQPAGDPDGPDAQHQGDITHGCLRCGTQAPCCCWLSSLRE